MSDQLTIEAIARMVDLSVVKAEHTQEDVRAVAETAKEYGCIACFTLPCHTPLLKSLLAGAPGIRAGGVVGFPAGGTSQANKVAEATELVEMGCDELDMVINVGMLRSGDYGYVQDDIGGVVQASGGLPVKVIFECHYLSDEQIRKACGLCVDAGAAFVKTGTGWAETGATEENIALMKSCVGSSIGVKAAGGVRDLETLLSFYRLGATRFGIGMSSARSIFEQCTSQPGETTDY
jgi:deoxyribose-phosphate aldolase